MPPRRKPSNPPSSSTAGKSPASTSSPSQSRPRSGTVTPGSAQGSSGAAQRSDQPARPVTPEQNREAGSSTTDQGPSGVEKTTPRKATTGNLDLTPKNTEVWPVQACKDMDAFYAEVLDYLVEVFGEALVRRFDEEILPKLRVSKDVLAKVQPIEGSEVEVYEPVAKAVNDMFRRLGLEYFLGLTYAIPESGVHDLKPDIVLYRSDNPGYHASNAEYNVDKGKEYQARTSWTEAVAIIEVKTSAKQAPFNFDDGPFTVSLKDDPSRHPDSAKDSRDSRAQMVSYVAEMYNHQHRHFVITAFIQGSRIRFMRWDRAGAIVSRSHDWTKTPDILLKFFWCLAQSKAKGQGYDHTVRKPAVPPFTGRGLKLRQVIANCENPTLKEYIKEATGQLGKYPWSEVQCQDFAEPEKLRTFYIARPHTKARYSVRGRGTKGYLAWDPVQERFVFIKDFWYSKGTRPECQTYRLLHENKVCNISGVVAGGDVGGDNPQTTLNQRYFTSGSGGQPSMRTHHRVVLENIGRPLETHKDQKELLKCSHDAFLAHEDAYEKAGVLHRDISPNNIMIDIQTGRGFLNDWDLAKYVGPHAALDEHPAERSGTWPYMSAPLLMYPLKPNHLSDDLESFLHSLELLGIRFYQHEKSGKNAHALAVAVFPIYYAAYDEEGYHMGGEHKWNSLIAGVPLLSFKNKTDRRAPLGPLPQLIGEWRKIFASRYRSMDKASWSTVWGMDREDPTTIKETLPLVMESELLKLKHADLKGAWESALQDRDLTAWDTKLVEDQLAGMPSIYGTPLNKSSTGGSSRVSHRSASAGDA